MLFTREEKHGLSANSATEHSAFFSPPTQLLSVRKAEKDEEKALMKGRRKM